MNIRYLFLLLLLLATAAPHAQTDPAPVIFNEDTLFYIDNKIGTFTPEQRAERVSRIIDRLSTLPLEDFDSLNVVTLDNGGAEVYLRDEIITSISPRDSTQAGGSAEEIARRRVDVIRQAWLDNYANTSWRAVAEDVGIFVLALLLFLALFYGANKVFDHFRNRLERVDAKSYFSDNFFVRRFSLITAEGEKNFWLFALRMLRYTVLLLFLYLYLPFLFSRMHYTRGFGERLLEYVLRPLHFIWTGVTGYLPNLIFIVVILVSVHYLLRAMRYVADQVRSGTVAFNEFYPDWALPTFNIARVLVLVFALVIVFPLLPGAGSDAFQGVSVFIGLLLSLGSAGIIGNVISGVVLTYMRPFVVGDRVKIGDVTGDVMSKTLLVTKIRTVRNEEITIPNGILMSGGVLNYTAQSTQHGLVLHTSITIGYDVPWRQVHELMISAALNTSNIAPAPSPFVLQKALNDWYVEYELNAYTNDSHRMARTYSDLHANIQDAFNAAGVEIMSSHYMAVRDGNASTIPVKE